MSEKPAASGRQSGVKPTMRTVDAGDLARGGAKQAALGGAAQPASLKAAKQAKLAVIGALAAP
jgi:hypothetical protein